MDQFQSRPSHIGPQKYHKEMSAMYSQPLPKFDEVLYYKKLIARQYIDIMKRRNASDENGRDVLSRFNALSLPWKSILVTGMLAVLFVIGLLA